MSGSPIAERFPAVDGFVRWARSEIRANNRTPSEIVRLAIDKYGRSPAFLESFVREAFEYLALEAAEEKISSEVGKPEPETPYAPLHADLVESVRLSRVRRAAAIAEARNPNSELSRFFEKHPATKIMLPLLMMTREELLRAAVVRDEESAEARRRAALCRQLADGLKPGQVARDRYSEDDVAELVETIKRKDEPKPIRSAS